MNNIYVIYASLENVCKDFDDYLKKISSERQQRVLAMKSTDARVNSLGGALLLNEAARRFGVDVSGVCYAPNGKPYIDGSDFCFSISHSKGYAACSFGSLPSGCDIQVKENANLKIAERVFSKEEQEQIFKAKIPEDEFFRVWCKRESCFKLTQKNECTIKNESNVHFKEYNVSDRFCLVACAYDNLFFDAEEIIL